MSAAKKLDFSELLKKVPNKNKFQKPVRLESRNHVRYPLCIQLKVDFQGQNYQFETVNISIGGMKLKEVLPEELQSAEFIDFKINYISASEKKYTFTVRGNVKSKSPSTICLRPEHQMAMEVFLNEIMLTNV